MRDVLILTPDPGVFAFLFEYGVCVLCGYDYEAERRLVDLLLKYAVQPLEPVVEEELTRLASFETAIEETINRTRLIPETLARKGSIAMSRRSLARERGRVYLEKAHIVLKFNLLDTPEFLWEYPELERYYLALARYLEIRPRAAVLENRLEVIQELLEMMADEQKHRHSSLLEWIIIVLIAIEIVLFFVK